MEVHEHQQRIRVDLSSLYMKVYNGAMTVYQLESYFLNIYTEILQH